MSNKVNTKAKIFIKEKMISELTSFLTTGRKDNDLKPYTKTRITEFLHDNDDKMNVAVDNMIKLCEEDGDLDELETMPNDAFREVLYEHFDSDDLLK